MTLTTTIVTMPHATTITIIMSLSMTIRLTILRALIVIRVIILTSKTIAIAIKIKVKGKEYWSRLIQSEICSLFLMPVLALILDVLEKVL